MNRSQVAWTQGVFWTATGVWPVVAYKTFERVTGRKREPWLVKTVGLLIGAIGGTLLVTAAKRRPIPDELVALASSAAGALVGVDLVYAANRRISPVYLLDAGLELALVAAWALARRDRSAPEATMRPNEGLSSTLISATDESQRDLVNPGDPGPSVWRGKRVDLPEPEEEIAVGDRPGFGA